MKISFVIPFHNEQKNVGPMIEQVIRYAKSQKWDFEIIPVNDRSRDKTQSILEKYAKKWKFIHPFERKGDDEKLGNTMGKSLLEGTQKAKGKIIIWTMGDRADKPETYSTIVKKILDGYDMVIGSRYMPGGSRGNLDPLKANLSSFGTTIARILFGVPSHDITNAFRGFRSELVRKIPLESTNFAVSPEFAIKAHLSGYRLSEVPTVYHNRVEGVSSFKIARMTISYLQVYLKLFLRKLMRESSIK